jgi:hypothetical protein
VDTAFWEQQLADTKAAVAAHNAALIAIASGAQSYQLDTGQTRQLVTKANLASIRDTLNELLVLVETLETRLYGRRAHVVPGW